MLGLAPAAWLNATLGVVDYLRDPVRAENLRGHGEPDLAERFDKAVRVVMQTFTLCPVDPGVQDYRDDIGFFDSVRIWMAKFEADARGARGLPNPPDVELALRQLTAGAVTADTNSALTATEIITELVALAKEIYAGHDRAWQLGLYDDELAFYDAVATNESAVAELGTGQLAVIARDLVRSIRQDVTVGWAIREQARARLRSKVKRFLAKYGYPPGAERRTVVLVLKQTELFAENGPPEHAVMFPSAGQPVRPGHLPGRR